MQSNQSNEQQQSFVMFFSAKRQRNNTISQEGQSQLFDLGHI